MSHRAQLKGVRKGRGAKGGGISRKRSNLGQKKKVLPMEVLLAQKPPK